MKQLDDRRTIDFFEGDKRGRGRPRGCETQTDAQRAARYRRNRKLRAATENAPAPTTDGQIDALNAENIRLAEQLKTALEKLTEQEQALKDINELT